MNGYSNTRYEIFDLMCTLYTGSGLDITNTFCRPSQLLAVIYSMDASTYSSRTRIIPPELPEGACSLARVWIFDVLKSTGRSHNVCMVEANKFRSSAWVFGSISTPDDALRRLMKDMEEWAVVEVIDARHRARSFEKPPGVRLTIVFQYILI